MVQALAQQFPLPVVPQTSEAQAELDPQAVPSGKSAAPVVPPLVVVPVFPLDADPPAGQAARTVMAIAAAAMRPMPIELRREGESVT